MSTTAATHEALDPDEIAMLRRPQSMAYLPEDIIDYEFLFDLPHRFVLRQLGLEVVAASFVAGNLRRRSREEVRSGVAALLRETGRAPFQEILSQCARVGEAMLLLAISCTRWGGRHDGRSDVKPSATGFIQSFLRLELHPRDPHELLRLQEHFEAYRRVFASISQGFYAPALRALQCVEYFPSTISDHAAYASSPLVRERRRRWRRFLHARELRFDPDGRIVGGLKLQRGITMRHVWFAYPQLRHHLSRGRGGENEEAWEEKEEEGGERERGEEENEEESGVLRPTLVDVSLHLPAKGATTIIGPSGSGKSTLAGLLKRAYDPLVGVRVEGGGAGDRSAAVWTEAVLAEVVRLQGIESPLPLPPSSSSSLFSSSSSSSSSSASSLVEGGADEGMAGSSIRVSLHQPGGLRVDGLPLACLSTTYWRRWLAQLEQFPLIDPTRSFRANLRWMSEEVVEADVLEAARRGGCMEFIHATPRGLESAAEGLSGGEQQRLALARVVAATLARLRGERIAATMPLSPARLNAGEEGAGGGLLLDEPSSRLDACNERRLREAVEGLARDLPLMVVIIAHRLGMARFATHMIVMEGGRVVGEGPFEELLRGNDFARQQASLQTLLTSPASSGE
ncbi:unnamed protein product [Phytomonas sp. EM1]|nr:unnamed protein product [Phytomonas sp. EM1]|eukprot:CCW64826.1 unnamed protein product [Phytomonas sp. isolate EM1]